MKNDSTMKLTNGSAVKNKLLNLSKKLYGFENEEILRNIHSRILGALNSGRDISELRNLDNMKEYVSKRVKNATENDVEIYHRLFVNRFGREINNETES